MKKLMALSLVSLVSASSFATVGKYCNASKTTVVKIEKLRISEIPFDAVKFQTVKILASDKCVISRLVGEEIITLSEMLLDYKYNQDSAGQIIGEFLAQ